jgi:hypothetical protein
MNDNELDQVLNKPRIKKIFIKNYRGFRKNDKSALEV